MVNISCFKSSLHNPTYRKDLICTESDSPFFLACSLYPVILFSSLSCLKSLTWVLDISEPEKRKWGGFMHIAELLLLGCTISFASHQLGWVCSSCKSMPRFRWVSIPSLSPHPFNQLSAIWLWGRNYVTSRRNWQLRISRAWLPY